MAGYRVALLNEASIDRLRSGRVIAPDLAIVCTGRWLGPTGEN